jgi:hypothetical protein
MADYRRHFDDDSRDHERGWAGRAREEVRSWFGDESSRQRRGNDERDDRFPYGGDRSRYDDRRAHSERYEEQRGSRWDPPRHDDRYAERHPAERYRSGGDRERGDYGRFGPGWSGRFRYPHGTDADEYYRAAREQREDFDRWSALSPGAERPNYYGRGPKDYRRSDERIREEIADRMTDDWTLDASDITVAVSDGEVTLSGTVSSRNQKRRAEDVAERVSGVRDVSNQLRVSRGWSGGTPETPGKSPSGTPA